MTQSLPVPMSDPPPPSRPHFAAYSAAAAVAAVAPQRPLAAYPSYGVGACLRSGEGASCRVGGNLRGERRRFRVGSRMGEDRRRLGASYRVGAAYLCRAKQIKGLSLQIIIQLFQVASRIRS